MFHLLELADRNDSPGKFTKPCGDSIDDCKNKRQEEWSTSLSNGSKKCIFLTFVFFNYSVQKLPWLHHFPFRLWSQLERGSEVKWSTKKQVEFVYLYLYLVESTTHVDQICGSQGVAIQSDELHMEQRVKQKLFGF